LFALTYVFIVFYVGGLCYYIWDSKKESDREFRIRQARRERG